MLWRAIDAPVPADGVPGTGEPFSATPACSAGDCVVAGLYRTTGGEERRMIETLSGGSWTAVEVPVPAGGVDGSGAPYTDLACSTAGTCVLPGRYRIPGGEERLMIDTLSGGSWSAIETPVPAAGEVPVPNQDDGFPACSGDGTCVVLAGYRTPGGEERQTIDTLVGGSWNAVDVPVPAGGVAGSGSDREPGLDTISIPACSSDATCVLPGSYETTGGEERGMIATLSGGAWSAIAAPVPAGGQADTGAPNSPACSSGDNCIALSGYQTASAAQRYGIDVLSGGSWSARDTPLPAGGIAGSGGGNAAPACSADGTCVVAGVYDSTGGNGRSLLDTLSGGTWSATETPVPAGGQAHTGGTFTPACSADGTCVATGQYYADAAGEFLEMIATFSGGSWSTITAPVPAGGGNSLITVDDQASACAADGTCVAPGTYRTSGGEERAMLDSLVDGSWTAADAPVPSQGEAGSADLYSNPACAGDGTCVVAGAYETVGGASQGMIAIGEKSP
jgi:hypothetical protein